MGKILPPITLMIFLLTVPAAAQEALQVATDTVPQTGLSGNRGHRSTPEEVPAVLEATPARPCYWRVATRGCGQDFDTGIGCCRLTTEMCTADGRFQRTTLEQMLDTLQPGVPICIFIHGSQVNERTSRIESGATYRWLRASAPSRPIQMISFDWPSDTHIGLFVGLDFIKLGRQAARNGFPLAQLVQRLPIDSPICVLGHSHGARAAISATHLLAGGHVQGHRLRSPDNAHRIRLILAAGAVDHDWLNPGERYDCAIGRCECVVNMKNCLDYALIAYPTRKVIGPRALGQSGFTRLDVRRLGPNARKISELDVNDIMGARHDWPNYYHEPQIARAIAPIVFFTNGYQHP